MLAIDPAAVLTAAASVDASAQTVADIDVAGPVSGVSDALVASSTSEACTWLSTRLGAALQCWSEGLGHVADAARFTAQQAVATDQDVSSRMGGGRVAPR